MIVQKHNWFNCSLLYRTEMQRGARYNSIFLSGTPENNSYPIDINH